MGPSAPPGGTPRNDRVEAALRAAADRSDGFLPFDRFMEIALYAPEVGYYTRPDSPFGRSGDFYTASHVHPIFARTVAARALEEYRRQGAPGGFRIIDAGPGDGSLALDVGRAVGAALTGEDSLTLTLVDRTDRAVRALADAPEFRDESARIRLDFAGSIGSIGPFRGVVIANELLDAFPARRLRWDGSAWNEYGAVPSGDGWSWASRPMTGSIPGPNVRPGTETGQLREIAPAQDAWMREVADHLVEGVLLVIDYGTEEGELLSAHRSGTLAAVRRHIALADPLDRPGTADLSTFLDFTRLRAAARTSGLAEIAYTRMNEALGRWGFSSVLEEALARANTETERVQLRLAAKSLLFGFENFRVLECRGGAETT